MDNIATPITSKISEFYMTKDREGVKKWLSDESNYTNSINEILRRTDYVLYFLPLLSGEKIASLIATNELILKLAMRLANIRPNVKAVIENMISRHQDVAIVNELKSQKERLQKLNMY